MINLSKDSIAPSAQFLEQAQQIAAYTSPDRGDRTWLRSPSGVVAFVAGHLNPAIRLRSPNRTVWSVTSLTPLEAEAIEAGIPVAQLVPSGPVGVKCQDHWDAPANVIAWAHGAQVIDAPRPLLSPLFNEES